MKLGENHVLFFYDKLMNFDGLVSELEAYYG